MAGWSLDNKTDSGLVVEAGRMAITRRSPSQGLIVHSDQGSQYASDMYRGLIQRHGFVRSMSRKGDCWDNAIAESFFATLKGDLIERRTWRSQEQVKEAVREWIEVFYNGQRRHSALGNVTPIEYECLTRERSAA